MILTIISDNSIAFDNEALTLDFDLDKLNEL